MCLPWGQDFGARERFGGKILTSLKSNIKWKTENQISQIVTRPQLGPIKQWNYVFMGFQVVETIM
jgi:hypothetical protein